MYTRYDPPHKLFITITNGEKKQTKSPVGTRAAAFYKKINRVIINRYAIPIVRVSARVFVIRANRVASGGGPAEV